MACTKHVSLHKCCKHSGLAEHDLLRGFNQTLWGCCPTMHLQRRRQGPWHSAAESRQAGCRRGDRPQPVSSEASIKGSCTCTSKDYVSVQRRWKCTKGCSAPTEPKNLQQITSLKPSGLHISTRPYQPAHCSRRHAHLQTWDLQWLRRKSSAAAGASVQGPLCRAVC